MSKANQNTAKKLLWEEYERQTKEVSDNEPFTAKEDFNLSENFYFSNDGIVFSYPPYALGSFAEGEKTLTLPWYDANKLITAEYQRTKKDGFGLGESW